MTSGPKARSTKPTASFLAVAGARLIEKGFDSYMADFREVTRRAARRFAERDWHAGVADATERLDLYPTRVQDLVDKLRALHGDRAQDRLVWAATKAVYSGRIAHRHDCELAETFYNSITRKIFATVGVDQDIEFVHSDFSTVPRTDYWPVTSRFEAPGDLPGLIESILEKISPPAPFRDRARSARRVAERLERTFDAAVGRAEVLDAVFYRRKGAYIIGRIDVGGVWHPLVLALLNTDEGMVVDAVLTDSDAVSILFSFTRSHFHVDLEPAHEVVAFLSSLMPHKRLAELYIGIGHHKHGKTLLYRDVMAHLASSTEIFDVAPGIPGLVMITFTMPDYEYVFKVIRDHFPPVKSVTRTRVKERYRLVFRHDRAGRLVEAQEFEHLSFDRDRFAPRLLDELVDEAGKTVHLDGDSVVIDHCYIERRVTPLNLYVEKADFDAARRAVVDYGTAIGEMARTGIFPGDLLLKNFGVTRHGRVVSYDYDELSLIEELNFRKIPQAREVDDEMSDQPWFGVGPNDIFPEEFRSFLGLSGELREAFETENRDLFDVDWWKSMQDRLAAGEIIDIRPYWDRYRIPWQERTSA